ncbi:unnamed protein product [Dibothriocephalus latus]|uniref:Dynactin subunit 2 n=1 Tax=Dibothriocephalus latus TaxID=60516 RepID=A0A3P7LTJ4_DIBLA|nr:unnamed protein product [Dibothriocephalus latus]
MEVRQLMNDAETVGTQMKQADPSEPLSASELKQMASTLNEQLSALQIEDIFGPNAAVDLTGQEAILQKRIVEQINAFKPREKPTKGARQDHITYDLYMKPSLKDEGQNQKPGNLDQIESRLASLQTKLQSITEKRETIADADSQHKIAELYELVKKWSSMADDLPQIVQRLQDLQILHEQASEFSSSIASMELEQKRIDQNLETYGKLLNQTYSNLLTHQSAPKVSPYGYSLI